MGSGIILLVEDNATQRAVMELMCESFDYELIAVATGEEALRKCASYDFVTILMDLGLPGMGGLECAERIRELDRKAKRFTPIIAVTAHKDKKESCIKAGFNDFISKPFSHEAFRALLLRWAYRPDTPPNLKLLKPSNNDKFGG